jgi:hypothetical protein
MMVWRSTNLFGLLVDRRAVGSGGPFFVCYCKNRFVYLTIDNRKSFPCVGHKIENVAEVNYTHILVLAICTCVFECGRGTLIDYWWESQRERDY